MRQTNAKGGKRLIIHAYPDARKTRVREIIDETVHLDVAAPAENNKANVEIEKFLTKTTGKAARVVAGKTSKRKIVQLR